MGTKSRKERVSKAGETGNERRAGQWKIRWGDNIRGRERRNTGRRCECVESKKRKRGSQNESIPADQHLHNAGCGLSRNFLWLHHSWSVFLTNRARAPADAVPDVNTHPNVGETQSRRQETGMACSSPTGNYPGGKMDRSSSFFKVRTHGQLDDFPKKCKTYHFLCTKCFLGIADFTLYCLECNRPPPKQAHKHDGESLLWYCPTQLKPSNYISAAF